MKTRKFSRKALLALRQGLVCNRCDAVISFGNLEVDHI